MSCPHIVWRLALCLASLAPLACAPANAQDYPERPIRFIVPNPPGGGTDILARTIAQKTGQAMGWTLVVENRPGAGGNIGLDLAAKAAPDGYTIVMGESSNLAINPSLYGKLPYDSVRDFTPIVLVGAMPLVLVTGAQQPYRSLQDLVTAGRAGTLDMGSAGNGTVGHLAGEMFGKRAGITLLHVPYKGAAAVMNDTISGEVDFFFGSLPSVIGQIRAGKLRALAVSSAQRQNALPDVPTVAESGHPQFEANAWYGILVPSKTPDDIAATLGAAFGQVLASPDMRRTLAESGVEVLAWPSDRFGKFIASERAKWAQAVKDAGARVD